MAQDSNPGVFVTTAVLAGGGIAGYLGSRWLVDHWPQRPRQASSACPAGCAPAFGPRLPAPPAPPTRQFDSIFERWRDSIPIEYLRALAARESGMNPGSRSGPAWGLLQIVEVVRRDYNRMERTAFTREDLLDPEVNVAIACWLLHRIIASYRKNHPRVANLLEEWTNRRFVELLTFGWNAGYSEAGGVGRVTKYLEARGITDITIDVVRANAEAAGASRHLSRADKVSWCKNVASLYRRELESPIGLPPVVA